MIAWKVCKFESLHTIELSSTPIIKQNALDYECIAHSVINSAVPVLVLQYTALTEAL
jgi:hypothetical protein